MTRILQAIQKPSWKIRRRIIVATLIFCALVVIALTGATMFLGVDTALAGTIALGCFGLAGSTVGSYIFGAAWDDKNHKCPEPVQEDTPE
jgi:hypothetical protein